MALTQMPLQHLTAAGRLPQPAKYQVGSNTAAMQFSQLAPVEPRQHDGTAGVAGGGGDQAIKQIGVLHLVAPPQRLDPTSAPSSKTCFRINAPTVAPTFKHH